MKIHYYALLATLGIMAGSNGAYAGFSTFYTRLPAAAVGVFPVDSEVDAYVDAATLFCKTEGKVLDNIIFTPEGIITICKDRSR